MNAKRLVAFVAARGVAIAFSTGIDTRLTAQQTTRQLARASSADLNGLLSSVLLFYAADADKDNAVTRDELKAALERGFTAALRVWRPCLRGCRPRTRRRARHH
jgi:hypothetical protein